MIAVRSFATTCTVVAFLLLAPAAWAQLRIDRPADPIDARQTVNVYVRWGGVEAVDGLRITPPPDWDVQGVHSVRSATAEPLALSLRRPGDGTVEASSASPLVGAQTFVVGLRAGTRLGYQRLRVEPSRDEEVVGTPETWQAYVREAPPTRANQALALADGAEPVALRRRALPSLDPSDPLTLEFWINTVGMDEVVLSTWNGDEERPYPLELVVDGRGRLVFYRGRPGWHEAMASSRPIADGWWHHVAFVNDPFSGWAQLLVDGSVVDSLRSKDVASALNAMPLALGGRAGRSPDTSVRTFSGRLDELRLWSAARTPVAIRRTMRVPLTDLPANAVRLSFDAPFPPSLLVTEPEAEVRGPSDLSFVFPVEALEASVQGGVVTLTWRTKDRRADAFAVERSRDGQRFETVGRVAAGDRVGETTDGAARFAYTDLPPDGHVLYYRVRQLTGDGPERVSGALKLGLGEGEAAAVAIVGNSPNPFRTNTTVTFDLARREPVRLSVWDVSGTRVAVLLNETLDAGRHHHVFRADGLPSGVYFVRVETPSGRAAHKVTRTR